MGLSLPDAPVLAFLVLTALALTALALTAFGSQQIQTLGLSLSGYKSEITRHTWFGFLGSEDAPQALGFLPTGSCMAGNLDQHIGLRDVNGVVPHLGQEHCVHLQ